MWLVLAFASTGFLAGNLIAMSASGTVPSFLGLLFALLGGSLIALLHKLGAEDRVVAGKLVLALSSSCLVGVCTGLFVNERQLLTPKERRFLVPAPSATARANPCTGPESVASKAGENPQIAQNKYLAATLLSEINAIEEQKHLGILTPEQAYDKLLAAARERCGVGTP